jgi:predicted small lipoprotein YifL
MKAILLVSMVLSLAACGDKVPESKAAKDLGNLPKQTLDKATTGVDQALTQNADKLKEAEEKK